MLDIYYIQLLTEFPRNKVAPVRIAIGKMWLFTRVGCAIYPTGYMAVCFNDDVGPKIARELIYNFADLINQAGVALFFLTAAKEITRGEKIRDAMR